MASSHNFSGLWIPLVTPFHNGAVDHPALARLVKHYAAAGVSGFVVCGSTGEAAALEHAEQLAVLNTVLNASDKLPVVMGLSGYHLGHTQAWIKELASHAIASLLVPAPHYIRPSQAGLINWFSTLADTSDLPMIVYDIPSRTGSALTLETLLTLAQHPRIVAIKDCSGDLGKVQKLMARSQLQVLAGDDANILSTLAMGGSGAIAASAHLRTADFVEVIRCMQRGEVAKARRLWQPLLALIDAAFAEPNPAPVKAGLAHLGMIHNELRLPMAPASAAHERHLQVLLDALK